MDVIDIIGVILDRERAARGVKSDKDLAHSLGITPKTVSQWRHGRQLPKAVRVLIPLMVAHMDTLPGKLTS